MMNLALMLLSMKSALALPAAAKPTPVRDCLAGVCLDDAAEPGEAVATVAGAQWLRKVDVCAGKIVQITAARFYKAPMPLADTDMRPYVVQLTELGSNRPDVVMYDFMVEGMTKLGWMPFAASEDGAVVFYTNTKTPDIRKVGYIWVSSAPNFGWVVAISAHHADAEQLCAKKDLEGL